jgi:hypothetical protein
MVPDGNVTVAVTMSDGITENVPVGQNVFATTSRSGFSSLRFLNSSGKSTEVPAPSRTG